MTPEAKQEKQNRLDVLNEEVNALRILYMEQRSEFQHNLVAELTRKLDPKFPLGVEIDTQYVKFFTVHEATTKKSENLYADFGSDVYIYNYMQAFSEDIEKMYETFSPELSASGIRISFKNSELSPEITKLQLLDFLAKELSNYVEKVADYDFLVTLKKYFSALRKTYRSISTIDVEVTKIKKEFAEAEKMEVIEKFKNSFKEGNWYKFKYNIFDKQGRVKGNVFFYVEKITTKNVTFNIFDQKGSEIERKRVNSEEVFGILNKEELLTTSPFSK